MSFDSILDSARKAAEKIQSVADKLKITLPKEFPDQVVQLNNCLDVYSASKTMIAAVVNDARGGFNVESMAKLTKDFDEKWDKFAKEYNELFNKSTDAQKKNVLETFATTHFGDNVFSAGSVIKNETPSILGGIVTFKSGINSFKGSYRNPEEAVKKIKTGIDSITAATERIAGSLNNIAKNLQGGDGATGVALLEKLSKLHEIKLLNVTSNALGVAQHGMAAYGSGKAALGSSMAALGDVKDLLGDIKKGDFKGAISSGKAAVDSVKDAIDDVKDTIKSGKNTIESAKATLSGLKGDISEGQMTGAAANITDTSAASKTAANTRTDAATSRAADKGNQGSEQDQQEESSGKSDSYVCSGATMRCTFGDKKAKLTVYPDRTVFLTGQPMANISDHISLYNIAGFGKCHTTRYPATGSATAANHGRLTPMPCVPGTNTEWKSGKDDYLIKGDAALLKSSYCKCRWGGVITITDDGQKDTGAADMSRVAAISMEQMLTETEEKEKQGLKPEAVLDGIQLALDAAGLAPGVGAIPDLLNASISALRGDWGAAGLSVLAAVPVIGDAATAAKFAQKGVKFATKARKAKVTVKQLGKTKKLNKPIIANEARKTAKRYSVELQPGSKGSWNKKLNESPQPNTDYKVGDKLYRTDETGKVRNVSGSLSLGKYGRNEYQQRRSIEIKDGRKGTDDGGHIIAHQFKGAGEQINYVPMLGGELNRGQWKRMEGEWQKALKRKPPGEVNVDINILYKVASKRPLGFVVNYTIDGTPYRKKFRNFTFSK